MNAREPRDVDADVAARLAGLQDVETPDLWDRIRQDASSRSGTDSMVFSSAVDGSGARWRWLAAAASMLIVVGVAAIALTGHDGPDAASSPVSASLPAGDCPPSTVVDGEPEPTHPPECASIHDPSPLGSIEPAIVDQGGTITLTTAGPIDPVCDEIAVVWRFNTDAFDVVGTITPDGSWQPATTRNAPLDTCASEAAGRRVTYRLPDTLAPGSYRLCRTAIATEPANDPQVTVGCGDVDVRSVVPTTVPSTSSELVTSSTTTDVAPVRPFVADPDVCVPVAARESGPPESWDGLLRPFALGVDRWERFQIVADPDREQNGPWALVGTVPDGIGGGVVDEQSQSEYRHVDTINGWIVVINTPPNGAGDATIDLGGDTDAYVRTTGFDLDSIRTLIESLTVRSGDQPVGFEYTPTNELAGLEVVLDVEDRPVDVEIARIECVVEGEAIYTIAATTGDAIAQYVIPLDQPAPVQFARRGDTVISISAPSWPESGDGPAPSDVTNAPPVVWAELLQQRLASAGPVPTATGSTPTTTQIASTSSMVVEDRPGAIADAFVSVVADDPTVIQVRDDTGLIESFDVGCPPGRDCVIESARVMSDQIWVTTTELVAGSADDVAGSRVLSIERLSGDTVEHLDIDGTSIVEGAGMGADGVVYATVSDRTVRPDTQLASIETGRLQILDTGVSGFRLSDDGRFLAVSFSNPSAGDPARFEITDLVDRTFVEFETTDINAGPAAWSADGRYLIVDEQWEDGTAWVIDPWSGSGDPVPGTQRFLDGACFVESAVIAHRTWTIGYGQGDARPGTIRLTDLDTGSVVDELGDDLFGDALVCHPDGSVSYLRRPVTERELSPGVGQLEPDADASVELVHLDTNGSTIIAEGDLRIP